MVRSSKLKPGAMVRREQKDVLVAERIAAIGADGQAARRQQDPARQPPRERQKYRESAKTRV